MGFDFDTYARGFDQSEFARQTMRTELGSPVDQSQLDLVRDRVLKLLDLTEEDSVLDLCCGNGHLMQALQKRKLVYTGVDCSPFLIEVAKKYFEISGRWRFFCSDALDFLSAQTAELNTTKVLWYGAFQYFEHQKCLEILEAIRQRLEQASHVLIGNLPNLERAHLSPFAGKDPDWLQDTGTPVGRWWTPTDAIAIAEAAGWSGRILEYPSTYHGWGYRFDLLLERD